MNQTSEYEKRQQKFEWIGPDFTENGYSNARYRISKDTIRLREGIETPARVEVLDRDGKWRQHPVVFIHYGSYETLKNGNGMLIMFLECGRWTHSPYRSLDDRLLFRQAQELGLTKDSQSNIKSIVKEGE